MTTIHLRSGIRSLFRRLRWRNASGPAAIAIVADGAIRDVLRAVFEDGGRELLLASTAASAVDLQQRRLCPVILFDPRAERDWRGALARLADLAPHPCVIVMSPRCDRNFWDEVTRHGGSDVLRIPLVAEDVRRTVESHASIWQCQQRLRSAEPRSTDQSFSDRV